MRILLQRVLEAAVRIDGEVVGRCGRGFLLFIGITHTDTQRDADFLAEKCGNLRVFEDENGKLNLSLKEVGGEILAVSQFTLYADASHGRRPSFTKAAPGTISEPLYEYFVQQLRAQGLPVETGRFGADMKVSLINDGPVTILLEQPVPKTTP